MTRNTTMTRDEILSDPKAAQAALDEVAKANKSPLPVAEFPPDDLVTLPGGLFHKGQVIKHVTVKELNGEDEEALARAIQHPNSYHFLDTLLSRGVARVGDLSEADSQSALSDMLVGDRDEVILGVRSVTYGPMVEVFNFICPQCGVNTDKLEFSLVDDTIERVKLKNPAADSEFEVSLRKGGKAKVRLATGAVQLAVFDTPDLLVPQRDDIMLSKCIETWTTPAGQTHLISGFPSLVRQMSSPDRRAILRELTQRQPGPRYNNVRFEHEGCGKEVSLALGITDLFRELLTGII